MCFQFVCFLGLFMLQVGLYCTIIINIIIIIIIIITTTTTIITIIVVVMKQACLKCFWLLL